MSSEGKDIRRRLIWFILIVALCIRLAGCFGMGFPHTYYPDESNNLNRSVVFHKPGVGLDLNPHWFHKPALGYYINFGTFGFYYLTGRYVTGWFDSPGDFADHYLNDRGPFLALARSLVALFGALTVLLVYRLGKALYSRNTGLVAATMLALCPGHVEWSQVVKHDVLAALLSMMSLCWMVKISRKGRTRDYLMAGFLCGLGMAAKYVPACMLAPLFFAHFSSPVCRAEIWKRQFVLLAMALAAVLGGFFLGSPYNLLDSQFLGGRLGFAAVFVRETDTVLYLMGKGLAAFWGSRNFTVPLATLALVGLIRIGRGKDRARGFLPAVVMLSTLVFIVAFSDLRPWYNHVMIMLPAGVLLAAAGWRFVLQRFPGINQRTLPLLGATGLLMLVPIPGFPGWSLGRHFIEVHRPQPRKMAMEFIQENVPEGAAIINDTEVLEDLVPTEERFRWIIRKLEGMVAHHKSGLEKATAADDARLVLHHETLLPQNEQRLLQNRLRQRAAGSYNGRRFDLVVTLKPWQTESTDELDEKSGAHTRLWSRMPLDYPGDLFPVERYRVIPSRLPGTVSMRIREDHPILEGSPPDFLVSSQESYDNYMKASKREAFPTWAAFYDDLKAHYDYMEFQGGGTRSARWALRLWDLRERKEVGREVHSLD